MKTLLGAAATALAFSSAAQPAPEEKTYTLDESIAILAERAAKQCDPAFDGDSSKGEHTNSNLKDTLNRLSDISVSRKELPLERIQDVLSYAVQTNAVLCADKRTNNLAIEAQGSTHRPNSVLHVAKDIISLPTADTREASSPIYRALTVLDAIESLQSINNQLQQAHMAIVMGQMTGRMDIAMRAAQQKQMYLNNAIGLITNMENFSSPTTLIQPMLNQKVSHPPLRALRPQLPGLAT